jgi:hypothetical protein
VQVTGIREPNDLLNVAETDMASIIKAHNQRAEFVSATMIVGKNLEVLVCGSATD